MPDQPLPESAQSLDDFFPPEADILTPEGPATSGLAQTPAVTIVNGDETAPNSLPNKPETAVQFGIPSQAHTPSTLPMNNARNQVVRLNNHRLAVVIEKGTFADNTSLQVTEYETPTLVLTNTHPITLALGTQFLQRFDLEVTDNTNGHPATFNKQVRLVADVRPWQKEGSVYQDFFLAYWDESLQSWVGVPAQFDSNGFLSADVTHFSSWALGVNPQKWAPSWTPPTVSAFSGAATFNYPIELPSGRNGLQPIVALSYSSRALDGRTQTMAEGNVADGWSLAEISIVRSGIELKQYNSPPVYGIPEMHYPDKYRLVFNGSGYELINPVVINSNLTSYTVRDNLGMRVLRYYDANQANQDGFFWIVQTPDGTQYRLGFAANSEEWQRVDVGWHVTVDGSLGKNGELDTAVAWYVDTVTDSYGNQMEYLYNESNWTETIHGRDENMDLTTYKKRISAITYNYKFNYTGSLPLPQTIAKPSQISGNTAATKVQFLPAGIGVINKVQVFHGGGVSPTLIREINFTYSPIMTPNEGNGAPGSCRDEVTGLPLGVDTRRISQIQETASGYSLPPVTLTYTSLKHFTRNGYGCSYFSYLTGYTNGYGGSVALTYTPDNRVVGSFSYIAGNNEYQFPTTGYDYFVTEMQASDGRNPQIITQYAYNEPCYGQLDGTKLGPLDNASLCAGNDAPQIGALVGFDTTTITHKDYNGSTTLNKEVIQFSQNMAVAFGQELKHEIQDSNNVLLQCTISTYNSGDSLLDQTDSLQFVNGGTCATTTTTSMNTRVAYTYDTLGNLTSTLDYGHTGYTSDDRKTVVTRYVNITAATSSTPGYWLVSYPNVIQEYAGITTATLQRETHNYYDQATSYTTPPTRGKVTKTEVGRNGASFDGAIGGYIVTAQNDYDGYGNLTSTLNPSNATTTITYDTPYALYPVLTQLTATGIEPQTTVYEIYGFNGVALDGFQVQTGLLKKMTNPNGTYMVYEYDPFGRLFATYDDEVDRQTLNNALDGNPLKRYRYWDNSWSGTTTPFAITEQTRPQTYPDPAPTGQYSLDVIGYYDGFGRTFQTRERYHTIDGVTGTQDIVTGTEFNALGSMSCQTTPFNVAPSSGLPANNCTTRDHTSYTYDALGREKTITDAGGSIIKTVYYSVLDLITPSVYYPVVTVIDANGHAVNQVSDARGQLIEVRNYTGTNPNFTLDSRTSYTYDWAGQLTDVNNDLTGANIHTSMSYDLLGRKIGMNDPDMGIWSYGYNASSQMTSQTDAKGVKICFNYDAYGRMTSKKQYNALYQGCTDTLALYYYNGTGTGSALGQLSEIRWPNTSNGDQFTYNTDGLLASQTRTINGRSYTMNYVYDNLNRPTQITYPSNGGVVTIGYDREGEETLTVDGTPLITNLNYNLQGQIAKINRSNATAPDTTFSYYSSASGYSAYRLQTIQHGTNSDIWPDMTYTYDNIGNVLTQATQTVSGIPATSSTDTQTFTYDHLNRLLTGDGTGNVANYSEDYVYDAVGNIVQLGPRVYQYTNAAHKHAVTSTNIPGVGPLNSYTYDANGNMITRTENSTLYTQNFDSQNRLSSVTVSGNTTSFAYDDNGQRVQMTQNGIVTDYPFPNMEVENATSSSKIVRVTYSLRGQSLAQKTFTTTGSFYYLYNDHLGSINTLSFANGNIVSGSTSRYTPFGTYRTTPTSTVTRRGFTSHLHNNTASNNLGLIYMNARYYVPSLGRFISADTLIPDSTNTQSWNRYTYVYNSPLTLVDNDGHCPMPPANLGSGQIICVAGFIPTAFSQAIPQIPYVTSGVQFTGDDRDFSAMGDPETESSRFFVWIDATTGENLGYHYHETCLVGGECNGPRPVDCGVMRNCLKISLLEDGTIELIYRAICDSAGAYDFLCTMTVNGSVVFAPAPEGGFDVEITADEFPNLEAYYWDNGELVQTLFQIQNFSVDERNNGVANPSTALEMLAPSLSGCKVRLSPTLLWIDWCENYLCHRQNRIG